MVVKMIVAGFVLAFMTGVVAYISTLLVVELLDSISRLCRELRSRSSGMPVEPLLYGFLTFTLLILSVVGYVVFLILVPRLLTTIGSVAMVIKMILAGFVLAIVAAAEIYISIILVGGLLDSISRLCQELRRRLEGMPLEPLLHGFLTFNLLILSVLGSGGVLSLLLRLFGN